MDLKDKSNAQIAQDIESMALKARVTRERATAENRVLSFTEKSAVKDLEELCEIYQDELDRRPVSGPLTVSGYSRRLGGSNGPFDSMGAFFKSVAQAGRPGGQVDKRLYAAATGLGESVPSDGGFLVQQDFSRQILQDATESGKLAKRCRRQPIGSNANGIKIPGVDETSRASTRYGGLLSYWLDEAALKTASKPKFRQIELALKKCVVLVYTTDELLQDAVALEAFLRDACPKEIGFSVDDAIINGTGAGQPLGLLSAGCLVTVAKETGQKADTIVAENVLKMVGRTLGDTSNYVWLHNKTCLQQIYQMSLAVGTGGIPLFLAAGSMPNQPENRLLGLPLIECEQCAALGDLGDLILADLGNGYIIADKGGVQADVSIHVQFIYDESVFRFVYRVDGQPVRASALTPYKGGATNTQSHFIAIAERA